MNWTNDQIERINAYVDGEMSAQELAAFEAEMARDDDLRAEVAVFARVRGELGALPELEVPRDFTIKESEPAVSPQVGWLGRLRWLGAVAALVLVCGVVALNFRGGGFLAGSASEPEMVSEVVATPTVKATREGTVVVEVEKEVSEEISSDSADAGEVLSIGLNQSVFLLEGAVTDRFTREVGLVEFPLRAIRANPYEGLCVGVVDVVVTSLEFEPYVGECPQAIGFQIGWDAAVVVANIDAPLKDDIAVADLVALFFEEDARWSDLNSAWRAEEIVRYVGEGERVSLEETVDGRLGDVLGGGVDVVRGDRNAVGYYRFGQVGSDEGVQVYAVNNVVPSEESIVSGVYPLSRKVYVYTTVGALESNRLVREYVAFVLETVNEEAEGAGFFAVDEEILEDGREILEGVEG